MVLLKESASCLDLPVAISGDDESRRYKEIMHGNDFTPITQQRVCELDRQWYGADGHKVIYNGARLIDWMPMEIPGDIDLRRGKTESLEGRLLLTEKAYHMAVFWPLSEMYVRVGMDRVKSLMNKVGDNHRQPRALELFTGVGSLLAAIRISGMNVLATVDNQPEMLSMAQHNFKTLGIPHDFVWDEGDAITYLNYLNSVNKKIDIVFADPEWSRKLHEDGDRAFGFSDMSPQGQQVVENGLKIAQVVAIKAPSNFNLESLDSYSHQIGANAHVLKLSCEVSSTRTLDESMIYFTDSGEQEAKLTEESLTLANKQG